MKTSSHTLLKAIEAIHPKIKLAAFLRFLGSYQHSIGNDFLTCLSQSEISLAIKECLELFEKYFCKKWITFKKTPEEEPDTKQHFYSKYGIPGIIGVVDGTHVRIKSPKSEERHLYYNRKGYYSLNVMIICDQNMVINFVDARQPGANHDSFIWKNSVVDKYLRNEFNRGKVNSWIIGDSGYPLLPYLMTPYRTINSNEQGNQNMQMHVFCALKTLFLEHVFGFPGNEEENFNNRFCKARNIIERCNGVLKGRFRSIIGDRGLLYSTKKATQIVNASCALHNTCIFYKNDWPYPQEVLDPEVDIIEEEDADNTAAAEIRRRLAQSLSQ
ncbi:putative nuclease HARBI1 [Lucilia cuprina]|nr:putative nuclease HARBI1 [Lucilia cuprina]